MSRQLFCMTCASADRQLFVLSSRAMSVMAGLVAEVFVNELRICWECLSLLKRIERFRNAAAAVQRTLSSAVEQQCLNTKSRLRISETCHTAIEPHLTEPASPANTQIKNDPKINNSDDNDEKQLSSDDECSLASIKVKLKVNDKKSYKQTKNLVNRTVVGKGSQRRKVKDSYKCKHCGEVFKTRGRFEYHKERHRDRPQCEQCGRTFVSKSTLWLHRQMTHGRQSERHPCDICHKVLFTAAGHAAHVAAHAAPHACVACAKLFKTSGALGKHLRTSAAHRDPADLRHACGECERRFDSEEAARRHRDVIHLKRNKHACGLCEREYCTARALRVHERGRHEGRTRPRDRVCEVCGKGFTTSQVLKSHQRTHTGERPYACGACPATFTQSGALHTHARLVHARARV